MVARKQRIGFLFAVAGSLMLAGCDDSSAPIDETPINPVLFANHSATPALVKSLPAGAQVYSLIGSDDVLAGSPTFIFGGSADGVGILKNANGTFTAVVNHEDNFAVSRVELDATFKPVSGEYILDSDNGRWRLCSATLATVEEHGFGPTYLTVGESSNESMIHAVNPKGAKNTSRLLPALGKWTGENALPLPKTAYSGKTVILVTDDDSGVNGGQLAMYVSNTVGDLDNGNLYVLTRNDGIIKERDMLVGQTFPVTFKQITNPVNQTGSQIDAQAGMLKAVAFGRTEDVDYRKTTGAGREIYFNVTGQQNTGVNADNSRTKYGRVYRLTLDAADPLKGTLEVVIDGDVRTGASPSAQFQNVDNILVTQNYVYTTEDPNGYLDETHDARAYQYNIATREIKVVMEVDHRRTEPKYNVGGVSTFGSWEFGVMLDISDLTGKPGSFLMAIQPHTWRGDRYLRADGGTARPLENQASQLIVVTGLER